MNSAREVGWVGFGFFGAEHMPNEVLFLGCGNPTSA